MKKLEITINEKHYPCRQTMGAMLRFKQETGKEVTQISEGSISDLCTYLWCCVKSACSIDGVEFNMSLMDFADNLSTEQLSAWSASLTAEEDEVVYADDAEKKSR